MLAISEAVKQAWLSPSRQLAIRVKMNNVTYESADISSLSFDSGSISGETYQIGSTYMNSIQLVFTSIIESVAEDIEVIPELGILIDGEYHYTKLGHFFVSEFERNRNSNNTTILANDKMMYLEGIYESQLSYPASLQNVVLEIANLSGVEINQASISSLFATSIVKPEGYTFRQAVGLISQLEGGFASFNRNGELEIRRLAPTTFEIAPESYLLKGFTKNENRYRIGGISVRTSDDESDVIRVGSTNGSQIELENKVMTQSHLNRMWDLVKTLNYFPFELKWRGCPALEAGDWITVVGKDGTKYSVPNLSYSLTFNGGMTAESKATTSSSSEATYKYRGTLSQRIDYVDSMLSANNWNSIYYDTTEPPNPKEGDLWFKKNGQYEEMWVYEIVDADGKLDWVKKSSTEPNQELVDKVNDLETDVQQATDTAENAANTASEAATKANNLEPIVNTANTNANTAVNNAQTALANAGTALTNAQAALNEANLAKAQSQQAIDKYTAMGMYPAWKMADGTFTKEYPAENILKNSKLRPVEGTPTSIDGWSRNALTVTSGDEYLTIEKTTTQSGRTFFSQTISLSDIKENTQYATMLDVYIESVTGANSGGSNVFLRTSTSSGAYVDAPRAQLDVTKVGVWQRLAATGVSHSSDISAAQYTLALSGDLIIKLRIKNPKLSEGATAIPYTIKPSEATSQDEYIPKYVGFYKEPSDNPDDYTWILNPDNVSGGVEIAITNINGELSQKVSQTTFDTLQGSVTAQATQINQNKTDIALKANQSTVDTLTGRVTTTEGSISTIAGQVALKANQTTVDTLSGKVSATESTLNTQAGQITALNTKTDGHTTQIGSLQSSYAGLSSTVSTVESNLNNLSVGGRNYLINTENPTSTNRVQLVGVAPVVVQTPTFIEGITRVEKTTENSNEMFYRFMGTNINNLSVTNLQPGETYTLGIDVRANLATTGKIYWRSQYRVGTGSWVNVDGWGTVPLEQTVNSSTFTRFEKALNIPANATTLYFSLQVYDSTGTIPIGTWFEFQKAKFELGNKATDHSPAPEDQATVVQLSNLTQTVNTLQGTVVNNENNTQAQLTLLSDQMTSVVETLVPNMFSNSDFRSNATGWTNDTDVLRFGVATSTTKASVGSEVQAMTYISQASMGTKTSAYLFGPSVSDLTKIVGKKVRVSFWYYTGNYVSLTNSPATAYVEYTTSSGQYYSVPFGTLPNKTGWTRVDKVVDLTSITSLSGFGIGIDVVKANFNGTSQTFYMTGFLLTTSEVLYDWGYATSKNAFYSQFTQLSSMLDLRVQKGDVLANITTEAGRVLIGAKSGDTGNYLMVTPTTTYIQDATIKSAMIESIVADKITAGTLNAANVNIINLNVDNLVGNKTSFVQSAWNSISSAVNVTAAGMTVSRSDGTISTIFQNDGIQIWGAGKWAGSLSWSSGPAVVLWAKTGHTLDLGYQGTNTATNIYSTAMSIDGYSGEIIVSSNIDFRLRRLGTVGYTTNGTWLFTRLSLNNVAGTALTNSQGNSGIWFGDNGYMAIRSRGTWYDMHTWLFGN